MKSMFCVLLLCVLLFSCNDDADTETGGVYIKFNNPTCFQVEVYGAAGRVGNELALINANSESAGLEWQPIESTFYFTYNISVDDCVVPYSLKEPRVVNVSGGETKVIDIPKLEDVLSDEEQDEPVTARAYINITNSAAAVTLFLHDDSTRLLGTINPGALPSRLIETKQSGSFEIKLTRLTPSTGVSRYTVNKDTGGQVSFPAVIGGETFETLYGGNVYKFEYSSGSAFESQSKRAFTVREALKDAGGGGGVPLPDNVRTESVPTPQNITVTSNSGGSAVITWNQVSGASKYYVYRITGESDVYSKIDFTSASSYTDTGLYGRTTYYYQVSAYKDGVGESELSQKYRLVTASNLSAPENLNSVGNSTSRVDLAWNEVSGAQGYCVFRAENKADGDYKQIAYTEENTYRDSGLTAGITYWYKIASQDGGGQSADYSLPKSVAILSVSTAAPSNVDAQALSSSAITISWDAVPGAEKYYIYKQIGGIFSLIDNTAATSWTDRGLSSGTIYYYRVSSFANGRESEKSTVVSATTL